MDEDKLAYEISIVKHDALLDLINSEELKNYFSYLTRYNIIMH